MATSFNETTSAGMPSIATKHDALDVGGSEASAFAGQAQKLRASAGDKVRGIAEEGKTQITQTLDGLAEAARDVAAKLEGTGAAPLARYAKQAADVVSGWSSSVDGKSIDDVLEDTRTLVRTSPAIAVAASLAVGVVLSRFLKATATGGSKW